MAELILDTKVLHVSRYSLTDKITGVLIQGCKISYLDSPTDDENSKGVPVVTIGGDISLWGLFSKLPGDYKLKLSLNKAKDNLVRLKLESAQLLEAKPHG